MSEKKQVQFLAHIVDTYIVDGAPLGVNLPYKMSSEIERIVKMSREEIPVTLLDDAMKEIYGLMSAHSFPR